MVDLGECNIKLCHSLGPPSEDLPNWRRVPGFPVFGVGQPTEKGFAKIPEKIGKEKTIWFNCRQEPVDMSMEFPSPPGQRRILMQTLRAAIVLRTNWSPPLRESRQK